MSASKSENLQLLAIYCILDILDFDILDFVFFLTELLIEILFLRIQCFSQVSFNPFISYSSISPKIKQHSIFTFFLIYLSFSRIQCSFIASRLVREILVYHCDTIWSVSYHHVCDFVPTIKKQ